MKQLHEIKEFQEKKKECYEQGHKVEQIFFAMAKFTYGLDIHKSTKEEDINDHVDFWINWQGEKYGIDVKSRNGLMFNDIYHIPLEIKNVQGKLGWIYGKAKRIAFLCHKWFMIVDREELVEMVQFETKKIFVDKKEDAIYKLYSRKGRQDIITYFDEESLLALKSTKLWKFKTGG